MLGGEVVVNYQVSATAGLIGALCIRSTVMLISGGLNQRRLLVFG
jgi:hypothetical protein